MEYLKKNLLFSYNTSIFVIDETVISLLANWDFLCPRLSIQNHCSYLNHMEKCIWVKEFQVQRYIKILIYV